jgi:hypothetical protein
LGDNFDGYKGAAAWQDLRVGLTHLRRFDRTAVVTDVYKIRNSVRVLGFAMPTNASVFALDNLRQVCERVSELGQVSLNSSTIRVLQKRQSQRTQTIHENIEC